MHSRLSVVAVLWLNNYQVSATIPADRTLNKRTQQKYYNSGTCAQGPCN